MKGITGITRSGYLRKLPEYIKMKINDLRKPFRQGRGEYLIDADPLNDATFNDNNLRESNENP